MGPLKIICCTKHAYAYLELPRLTFSNHCAFACPHLAHKGFNVIVGPPFAFLHRESLSDSGRVWKASRQLPGASKVQVRWDYRYLCSRWY